MRYWGKVVGLALGLLSGAGFWGIVIGLIIGHMFDKVRGAQGKAYFSNNQTRQTLFFSTTFQVMGHLTKSKGRVTEADIQIASLLWIACNCMARRAPRHSVRFVKVSRANIRYVTNCASCAAPALAVST